MHGGFMALRTNMPMNLRKDLSGRGRDPGVDKDIARISAIFNMCRSRYGQGGDFLFGHFTIADAMFAPVITRFKTYGVTLDPVGEAYKNAMLALPAMQEWYGDALKEDWVIEAAELPERG
jgi:glutathione S-transferase